MTDTLTVWWGHDMVGSLAINRHGDTSFRYAETWLAKPAAGAISLSLPLRAEPFSRRESRPFETAYRTLRGHDRKRSLRDAPCPAGRAVCR